MNLPGSCTCPWWSSRSSPSASPGSGTTPSGRARRRNRTGRLVLVRRRAGRTAEPQFCHAGLPGLDGRAGVRRDLDPQPVRVQYVRRAGKRHRTGSAGGHLAQHGGHYLREIRADAVEIGVMFTERKRVIPAKTVILVGYNEPNRGLAEELDGFRVRGASDWGCAGEEQHSQRDSFGGEVGEIDLGLDNRTHLDGDIPNSQRPLRPSGVPSSLKTSPALRRGLFCIVG